MSFSSNQKTAIEHVNGAMAVIAGPGSGKTTVITNRIKYLIEEASVKPEEILVITFTKAAANEMQSRFKQLTDGRNYPVRFGTFHSIFFWIIKTAYKLNNNCVFTEEEKRQLVESIMKRMNISPEQFGNKDEVISSLIEQMSTVKCDMIELDSYYSRDFPEEEFKSIARQVDEYMKKNSRIDFDDMMVMCYELLKNRQDILEKCKSIFKYIMIDEFQDSNRLQYEIFKLLAYPKGNAFIVGDDDQSIYGFRGARPEIMKRFVEEFSDVKKVVLGENYRCDRKITASSARLIKKNSSRFEKMLTSVSEEEGIVRSFFPEDKSEENDILISMIRQHYDNGVPYEKQAVLYRTNSQPRTLAYKLNQFNIPYSLSDSLPNIFNHFAVRDVIDYIKFATTDKSRGLFLRIMNKPLRYISRNLLVEEEVDLDNLLWATQDKDYLQENIYKLKMDLKRLAKLSPAAAINFVRKSIGYDEYLKKYCDEKSIDCSELYDILDEALFMLKDIKSFEEMFEFFEKYEQMLAFAGNKKRTGVNLLTMHSAKGLEYDCVYIIDAVEGVTPYKKAKSKAELEEERRMFYVAMTRAKHELYIISPKSMLGKKCTPSKYIKDAYI